VSTARQRLAKHVPDRYAVNVIWRPLLDNGFGYHGITGVCGTTQTRTEVLEPLKAVISILFSQSYKTRGTIVTLRVVGGDEMGSLKSETVKYGRESQGTRTRETALAMASSIYKRQTRPLVREGAPQKQDRNCQTVINIWSWSPSNYLSATDSLLCLKAKVRLRLTVSQPQWKERRS
jgi:hypothetical protein